ncbi:MAG: xanthine dehydrogenase family protein molybdopterin-binding subunit [Caulobacteraceae bacterium]
MTRTVQTEGLNRRTLLATSLSAAGGMMIGVALPAKAAPIFAEAASPETLSPREVNAWIVIEPDNTVLVRLAHAEMGQGTATALVMMVAEELECDWSQVKCEYASANRNIREKGVYKGMNTVGSAGVRTSVQFMQQAGASARARLVEAAAKRWNAPAAECVAAGGKVSHPASKRSLTYGALAGEAATITLVKEPAIKTPAQYKLLGKSTARLDTPPKLDGSAKFGIDTRLPGMVYAAVVSCPEFGAKLKSVDEAPAMARRGIIAVVKLDDAVAVVADRYWRAKAALDQLHIEWAPGPNATVDSAQLDKAYVDATHGPMVSARKTGDAAAALAAPGAKLIEAVYEVPNLAHVPMEPLNATVHIQPDRVDVWIGSQSPMQALNMAAQQTGVAPENVYVHNQFLGGGFGRRSAHDELTHAISVAKVVKKPVKLVWSREQDVRRDRYRPQAAVAFKAALDEAGKPTAFDSRIAVGSLLRSLGASPVANGLEPMAVECIATTAYKFPNIDVGVMLKNTHVPVGFWRSVGASQNTFFIESFIDEMAHAAGQDPYKFRRALLDRPDFLAVLDLMAAKGDWGKPMGPGRGRGMAIVETYGSITGQVAEVTVSPEGEIKVDRVVAVMDCYNAANPNTIEQQIEGGIVYGLSAVLWGEVTIKDGGPVQGNFNTYRLMKLSETPKIETYLIPSGGAKWGGVGEPSVAPVAPAVCNAIFAATGKRVRKLPLKNVDLKRV